MTLEREKWKQVVDVKAFWESFSGSDSRSEVSDEIGAGSMVLRHASIACRWTSRALRSISENISQFESLPMLTSGIDGGTIRAVGTFSSITLKTFNDRWCQMVSNTVHWPQITVPLLTCDIRIASPMLEKFHKNYNVIPSLENLHCSQNRAAHILKINEQLWTIQKCMLTGIYSSNVRTNHIPRHLHSSCLHFSHVLIKFFTSFDRS